jgi:hypothetical protein
MSLFPMATATVTWKRATAFVLDPVALSSPLSSDRAPVRRSPIQVRVTGSPTGTVTVSGNVDGSPDSEVLTWSGSAGYRATTKQFDAGTLTFTSSISGGSLVSAKAVGAGGDPQLTLYTVKGPGHPVSIEEVTEGTSPIRRQGGQEEGTHRLLVPYEDVWTPRRGDRVVNDRTGEVYDVVKVREAAGGLYVSHWVAKAMRLDDKGNV